MQVSIENVHTSLSKCKVVGQSNRDVELIYIRALLPHRGAYENTSELSSLTEVRMRTKFLKRNWRSIDAGKDTVGFFTFENEGCSFLKNVPTKYKVV